MFSLDVGNNKNENTAHPWTSLGSRILVCSLRHVTGSRPQAPLSRSASRAAAFPGVCFAHPLQSESGAIPCYFPPHPDLAFISPYLIVLVLLCHPSMVAPAPFCPWSWHTVAVHWAMLSGYWCQLECVFLSVIICMHSARCGWQRVAASGQLLSGIYSQKATVIVDYAL